MAANTSPIFEVAPIASSVQITDSDTTTKQILVTGGTNGTRVDGIYVSSTDSAAASLDAFLNDGTTDFYLGTVAITAGAGYTTVARIDAIATLAPTLGYLVVPPSYVLKVAAHATLTSGKQLDIVVQGGDY